MEIRTLRDRAEEYAGNAVHRAGQFISQIGLLRPLVPVRHRLLRVGVVGGVHPWDEEFPIELVESLQSHPIPGVHAKHANILGEAIRKSGLPPPAPRGVHMNLSWAFPGYPGSQKHEERCAWELMEWARRGNFDVILDVHTNKSKGDSCAFIHEFENDDGLYKTSQKAVTVAALLQFKKIVVTRDRWNISGFMDNAVTLDIASDSPMLDIGHWRKELRWLAAEYPRENIFEPEREFYNHLGTITVEEAEALGIPVALSNFALLGSTPTAGDSGALELGQALFWGPGHEPFAGEFIILRDLADGQDTY